MDPFLAAVFLLVYLGMALGRIPGLRLDRTGVALLGAIALIATGRIAPREALDAVDVPTILLLFSLMVLSAQLRLGGFYARITARIAEAEGSPRALLALLMAAVALLSALLANDVVCLATAPVLIEGCRRRGLAPMPYLLGLACASNIGSAATLIGNPQNMLIGQALRLPFAGYLLDALPPTLLALVAAWALLARRYRGRWRAPLAADPEAAPPPFDAWQTGKGLALLALLVLAFLFAPWPREVVALAVAGVALTSRRLASRSMLLYVDWHVILLFLGLFVLHGALDRSGALAAGLRDARAAGVDPTQPAVLFGGTVVLSNLVSNVPAVMLLLPAATHPQAGPILALASTYAGNLLLVGSIANLIVAEQAAARGITVGWREHARVGIPVTLVSLAFAALWLVLRAP